MRAFLINLSAVFAMFFAASASGAESAPDVKVVYEGNMPKIRVNGTNYNPWMMKKLKVKQQIEANARVSKLGFRFHEVDYNHQDVETSAGVYTFDLLDKMISDALRAMPNDYFFINLGLSLPKWCVANKGECVGYLNGRPGSKKGGGEFGGRPLRPSPASAAYRDELRRFFKIFGEYVKSRPWGTRIVGVRVSWGVYTEWHYYGQKEGPDVSPAMTAAFHRWKGGKWNGTTPPTIAERRRKGLMLDPVRDEKALDYFECLNSEVQSLLLMMLREAKKNLPGRLAGAYWGYVFNYFLPEGQNCILEGILDSPDMDFCSCPASYLAAVRAPGGTYHHRSVSDAFRRRGKLLMLEDDMRFHHVKEWAGRQYHTNSEQESHAAMLRSMFLTLFDGCGIQITDPFGGWETRPNTFDHPSILSAIKKAAGVLDGVKVAEESCNTLAVVVSPRERLRWANAIAFMQTRDISANVPHYVYTSGAAADIITLEDFLRSDKKWRNVIFPDAFTLSQDEIQQLSKRLKGAKSVWFVRNPPIEGKDHVRVAAIPCGNNTPGAPREQLSMLEASKGWGEIVAAMGEHIYTVPGECMRRHGDLILIATGISGEHTLNLPPGYCAARELISGKRHKGAKIVFRAEGPSVFLFKMSTR